MVLAAISTSRSAGLARPADTLDEFTGVGYFFGRMIRQWLGVPVGLLNITLGGSPIESWMDEQTLAAWPKALADLEPYRDDEVAPHPQRAEHRRNEPLV